jgi:hypoxanthine-guanine phosphoribosyltransferase
MVEEESEMAESIESLAAKQDPSKKILLVGTHQGASLVMAHLVRGIKMEITETMAKFAVRPQRSYPQRRKKGRSKSY